MRQDAQRGNGLLRLGREARGIHPGAGHDINLAFVQEPVITSYSIHYTKLYDGLLPEKAASGSGPEVGQGRLSGDPQEQDDEVSVREGQPPVSQEKQKNQGEPQPVPGCPQGHHPHTSSHKFSVRITGGAVKQKPRIGG